MAPSSPDDDATDTFSDRTVDAPTAHIDLNGEINLASSGFIDQGNDDIRSPSAQWLQDAITVRGLSPMAAIAILDGVLDGDSGEIRIETGDLGRSESLECGCAREISDNELPEVVQRHGFSGLSPETERGRR